MNRISASLFTGKNVSVVLDGKPYVISSSVGHFPQVLDAINENDADALYNLLQPKLNISVATEGRISYDGRDLMFNGERIHNAISDRLNFLWSRGLKYQPLLKFLDNLMDNPSFRAVNETYGFLEACNLPITDDGHFLAYKMVRHDYSDIYTGTMDNSVGKVVEVPRNKVDEDSNRTCSYGLHCCSKEYLFSGYGSWNSGGVDRILIVKVNPRDVVAVPSDYNNSKMRVSRYEVVGELTRDDLNLDEFYTPGFAPPVDEFDESDFDDGEWDGEEDEGSDEWPFEFGDIFPELDEVLEAVASVESEPEVTSSPVGQPIKLNEGKVRDIKRLLDQGEMSIANIARLYSVNESTIRKIRDGLIWAHVTI